MAGVMPALFLWNPLASRRHCRLADASQIGRPGHWFGPFVQTGIR